MIKQNLFYPLIDEFDRNLFAKLQQAVYKKYSFVGNDEEKIFFIKSLLCFQMLKDYRAPLQSISRNLSEKTDIKKINESIRSMNFIIDYSWAVWSRDKEMGQLVTDLFASPLDINGTQEDFDEFILRYLIAIWLAGWEGPLYALLQETKNGKADLKGLNAILDLWDLTKIFTSYRKLL